MTPKRQNLYALAILNGYEGPLQFCSDTCDNLVEYYSGGDGQMWCEEHSESQDIEFFHISQLTQCEHAKEPDEGWNSCPYTTDIDNDPTPCWCCDNCQGECADAI